MIRSFDWRDFPSLHRNRHRGLCLDTSLALTRSMARVPVGALLSYVVAPATGIYTYVAIDDGKSTERVIGQFAHTSGSHHAQLTFLSPESALMTGGVPALLDHLAQQAGKRGAHHLLAEVNDRSAAFEVLRKAGYATYARQRIWKIAKEPQSDASDLPWRLAKDQDGHTIRHLYASLVPALVQQTEPPPWENPNGMLWYDDGELRGYVHLTYGPNGILAQPYIHPNVEKVPKHLAAIIYRVPNQRSRPLYVIVRSYQAWLELYLTETGAEAGPYQAVMVKRLVVPQKVVIPLRLPGTGLDHIQPEVTTTSLLETETP